MKSWIRRFALLAVMGSVVGGIVMAGCTPAEDPDAAVVTPGDDTTVVTPPADEEAPPVEEDAPPVE